LQSWLAIKFRRQKFKIQKVDKRLISVIGAICGQKAIGGQKW